MNDQLEKLKRFVVVQVLGEAFAEFVKSHAPKSFRQKLKEADAEIAEQNRQKNMDGRKLPAQSKLIFKS